MTERDLLEKLTQIADTLTSMANSLDVLVQSVQNSEQAKRNQNINTNYDYDDYLDIGISDC